MDTLTLILMIAAIILFVLATFGVVASRFNLIAAGLACWALAVTLPLF